MIDPYEKIKYFFLVQLWREDLTEANPVRRWGFRLLRILYVLWRDLFDGQLTLRAMSLVYTTLLSLVPLLAVSFSVLKAFGVHYQIEPILYNVLAPLGERADEVVVLVVGFVEQLDVRILGYVGLVFLLYTVVTLLQKTEEAFNHVWRTKGGRSLARRFSDYLSVILVGPVLVFSAIGLTASLMSTDIALWLLSHEPFGTALVWAGALVPYVLIVLAFAFVYRFVPNTQVHFSSALVGGLVGGLLWQIVGTIFASFVATSTRYPAIYSSFAILILFMLWLYLSWLVLLFGAQVSFYHQHPQQVRLGTGGVTLSNCLKERLGFLIMYLVGVSYYNEQPLWTLDGLAQRLDLPGESVAEVLDLLLERGMIIETCTDPPGYLPAHDLEKISLERLRDAIREAGEQEFLLSRRALSLPVVDAVLSRAEEGVTTAFDGMTLRDLVTGEVPRK